ncbi:MAG: acyltransferase [Pedobacter sp.]|jgi:acetyltransferase-like isoleucine patch superfamily enzyme|uniref:acyltransferase n=1 Tax=Pedobacter sp. TaxID=1411316 RepID=UPI003565AFFE
MKLRPYVFIVEFWNFLRFKLLNFLIPNIRNIYSKKLSYLDVPNCQQRTIVTGIGKTHIGSQCKFGYKKGGFHKNGCVELQTRYENSVIQISNDVATNNNVFICCANYIEIGENTRIGQNVTLMDFEAHGINPNERSKVGSIGQIVLKKNVWVGNNVIILKNSEIGENSVVAAGAVVSGIFPSNVIIGGIPAKIIKNID